MFRPMLLAATAVALVAVPPAAAQQRVRDAQPITAQDRRTGAQANAGLIAEYGGLYDGPQAAYVTRIGQRVALQSGLSDTAGDFRIALLNSPVNNAFAIPGGYVYVTRQLVALMNDEAELAAVLGHEVGHVAARHSASRQSAATRNSVLGALGQLLVGSVAGNSGFGGLLQQGIGAGAQYFTARFSRSQETQADDLGIRYLAGTGYDPQAMARVLDSLAAQTALDQQLAGGQQRAAPAWASTHPEPGTRVARAAQAADRTPGRGRETGRDAFLSAIDGMLYGDDPRQGVIEGRVFRHPDLRLRFTAPEGFALSNGTQAVTIAGQRGQAQFTGARFTGDLPGYVVQAFRAVGGEQVAIDPQAVRTTTVNGIPAAYATVPARTQQGQVDVTVFAYRLAPDQAYHFVALAPSGGAGAFAPMFESVARLSAGEAGAIRPRRVRVVTVAAGDTQATLARRMAFDTAQLERFRVLNALAADTPLRAGERVKIVTY